jgi:hypothetical protein
MHRPSGETSAHLAFMFAKDCLNRPLSPRHAAAPYGPQWRAAMQQEFDSLKSNYTWSLVDIPQSRRVVNNMWIYKVETDHLGRVSMFEARFVVKGCIQRKGNDCKDTLSPVIRMASLRVFALAASVDRALFQLDIDTAFLYSPIKEDVCDKQPLGFTYR